METASTCYLLTLPLQTELGIPHWPSFLLKSPLTFTWFCFYWVGNKLLMFQHHFLPVVRLWSTSFISVACHDKMLLTKHPKINWSFPKEQPNNSYLHFLGCATTNCSASGVHWDFEIQAIWVTLKSGEQKGVQCRSQLTCGPERSLPIPSFVLHHPWL